MTKFEAFVDNIAKRAKAYVALVGSFLSAFIATGIMLPAPYDRYLAAAMSVVTAVSVFKVPNRREILDADVEAAKDAFDAIKASGAPAQDQPHAPATPVPAVADPTPAAAPALTTVVNVAGEAVKVAEAIEGAVAPQPPVASQ